MDFVGFIEIDIRKGFVPELPNNLNILSNKVWYVDITECLTGIDCFNEECIFPLPLAEGS
jgi:hypothetical protein